VFARSHDEIDKIYRGIDGIKRLSDSIIKIGPINVIGLDGILALVPIPAISTAYSAIAGAAIMIMGFRGRASLGTLFTALIILLIDTGVTTVEDIVSIFPPAKLLIGGADALFQGHLYAAHLIQQEMNRTYFVDDSARKSRAQSRHKGYLDEVKHTKGKSRLVYLHP
jgi:hypothetical protein